MNSQYLNLYTAKQTRELDSLAIESGMLGYSLMKKAGSSAFHFIMSTWPDTHKIIIVCGTGNNGGDGYVIARLAKNRGMDVRLIQLGDLSKQNGDSLQARQDMLADGVTGEAFDNQDLTDADVIVDALLGTGLQRDVTGEWRSVIEEINKSPAKIASLDIPSGLQADTGLVLGAAINADLTVTFIGRKQGMYTADGCEKSGRIKFDSLNISFEVHQKVSPTAFLLQGLAPAVLKPRDRGAHKGDFGNVVVVGGATGMNGAILLSATAALRTGCGLVTVLTFPDHAAFLNLTQPEVMCRAISKASEMEAYLAAADVILVGPGLGTDAWGKALLDEIISSALCDNKPIVIDADGLNNLCDSDEDNKSKNGNWFLTPHPGEAARLLNCSIKEIHKDRFLAARKISEKYNATCVLKGAGTIIHAADKTYICPFGNPGMATAGMGDVLSGILGTLLAQSVKSEADLYDIEDAVTSAVALHAMAGDSVAEKKGEKGMLASDLFSEIRYLVNAGQFCENN